MAQDGLKQRSPLRKSFIPSLRHKRQTGPEYLAKALSLLNSSSLRWTAPVVRDRCDVANRADLETRNLQCADRRIAACTGPLDVHFQRPHAHVTRTVRSGHCRLLGGEWSSLARS